MMLSTDGKIAVAELCVYIPVFLLTLVTVFRHGGGKQLGWIYLTIFCLVRVVGAGFKIASNNDPSNTTDLEWATILSSVGLSPLLMASLGLLKRVTDEVSTHIKSVGNSNMAMDTLAATSGLFRIGNRIITKRATANSRRSRIMQLAQLPCLIALILCVVGGTDAASAADPSDISSAKSKTKAGVIIFLCVYILLIGLVIITIKDIGKAPSAEKRIYWAVVLALPWLAVRVLFSILASFTDGSTFSITGDHPLVQLFMATVEEFIIVCLYTLAGLTITR